MEIGSASPTAAIAAGLRGELDARNLRSVLGSADVLPPDLDRALEGVEQAGRRLAKGGIEVAEAKLLGRLIDETA